MKWLKLMVGILLLPLCAGAAPALLDTIRATGRAETIWVAFLAGFACWLVIHVLLPRPMRLYVFGHELTHALWTWLFAGKVERFKVSANGGHVVTNRSNFLVTLAPYFFPVYAFLVVVIFGVGNIVAGWSQYTAAFHLLLGAAYAFHVTMTIHALSNHQTDITSQGYLFSAVVVWLANLLLLLVGIPLLTGKVGVLASLGGWLHHTALVLRRLGQAL
jgi:hypothetical protein